jgi:hypothetical protein
VVRFLIVADFTLHSNSIALKMNFLAKPSYMLFTLSTSHNHILKVKMIVLLRNRLLPM